VDQLTPEYLCHEEVEKNIRTRIYQVQLLHKNFPQPLNVVVIVKTNLTTGKSAKVLLFSDDLELAYDKLIDYYQLRFQIEFNFRDAKQYWGLEDFMNVNETQVSNAANFSLFMVTFSRLLLPQLQDMNIESMLDLKTLFRARKYTRRIINSLGINAEEFLIDNRIFEAAEIGRIHARAA
jgi:putative transposase